MKPESSSTDTKVACLFKVINNSSNSKGFSGCLTKTDTSLYAPVSVVLVAIYSLSPILGSNELKFKILPPEVKCGLNAE